MVSCGCIKQYYPDDLTGQKFGRLTVLYKAESKTGSSNSKATMWHCQCDCGTEKDIRDTALKRGTTRSCGCYKMDVLSLRRDLTGQIFGRWSVICQAENLTTPAGRDLRRWHCKCECGAERDVIETALLSGKSVSCGCYRQERFKEIVPYDDLAGKKFGEWTVLERLPDRHTNANNRIQLWKCRCSCGVEHILTRTALKQGSTASCGHTHMSTLESYVKQYLDEHSFKYEGQKKYDDLVGLTGRRLSYDFLVYKDNKPLCFIECQGKQHYQSVKFFGGDESLENRQICDKIKRDYAEHMGIPLIEVKHTLSSVKQIFAFLDEVL